MKFLHTSDLHIGKKLFGISFAQDQAYILEQIIDIAKQKNVDAIFVSGDIYDTSNPSVQAVSIFENFLINVNNSGIKIYISCGNHDNETRLSFGQSFFENQGIFISKPFDGSSQKYEFKDGYGNVNIYLLPYIKPNIASRVFDEEIKTYEEAVKRAVESLNCDKTQRNIILAHQFVVNGESDPETCESENIVGGVERVGCEIFADFDYTALGHIHKPQKIGSEYIRYSGTPLKYSISEKNHKKSVCVVEIKEKGDVSIEKVPLCAVRELREIKGSFDDIYSKRTGFDDGKPDDYIFISLTDTQIISGVKSSLSSIYENIVHISYENILRSDIDVDALSDESINVKDTELFRKFFNQSTGHDLSEIQEKLISQIIEESDEDEA